MCSTKRTVELDLEPQLLTHQNTTKRPANYKSTEASRMRTDHSFAMSDIILNSACKCVPERKHYHVNTHQKRKERGEGKSMST